jgi:RNA polymerase sigma factor (sigma-70 family)
MAVGAGSLTGLTDGALVERHLRGEDGLDVLYRRHVKRLVAYCTRITGNRDRGEDLAHDTVVRVIVCLDRFDKRRELWPWLKVIATRLAIDRGRLSRREVAAILEDLPMETVFDDDELVVERDLLVKAFLRLPPRQQKAVAYRYIQDWDPAEVADILGISRSAFEQLLYRARKCLREEYRKVSKGAAVVLGPITGAWRRLRSALGRAQATMGEAAASQWARLDPTAAVGAVMGTTTAALSVAAMIAVGGGSSGVVERPIGGVETIAAHQPTVESVLAAIPSGASAATSTDASGSDGGSPPPSSPSSPPSDALVGPAASAAAAMTVVEPEAQVEVHDEPVGKETSPDGGQDYGAQPIGVDVDLGSGAVDEAAGDAGDLDDASGDLSGPDFNCPPPEEREAYGPHAVAVCGTLDEAPL